MVAANGEGVSAYRESCLAGRSGLSRWVRPEAQAGSDEAAESERARYAHLKTSTVGACVGFDPTRHMEGTEIRRVPRMIPMALAASREALLMSGVDVASDEWGRDITAQRTIGVSLGTGGGGLAYVEEQYKEFFLRGKGSLFSITAGTHGNLSSELSIQLRLRGPSHVLSTGCASSTDAIAYGRMLIANGVIDRMLVGGADSPISGGILTAFERMRVIGTRYWENPAEASRPFQKDRDGFILGEGAWMFVLEAGETARARGANVLAEIVGYGSTCDAFHRVQIRPDVEECVRAIELALADAGISAGDVGYVNLHGTGTELNDKLETAAVKRVFGDRSYKVPMSSTKSMIGHPQGACGAAGLAATILCARAGYVHPTVNCLAPDEECDLDYVAGEKRAFGGGYVLCNCIAFGSKNSALVVKI